MTETHFLVSFMLFIWFSVGFLCTRIADEWFFAIEIQIPPLKITTLPKTSRLVLQMARIVRMVQSQPQWTGSRKESKMWTVCDRLVGPEFRLTLEKMCSRLTSHCHTIHMEPRSWYERHPPHFINYRLNPG